MILKLPSSPKCALADRGTTRIPIFGRSDISRRKASCLRITSASATGQDRLASQAPLQDFLDVRRSARSDELAGILRNLQQARHYQCLEDPDDGGLRLDVGVFLDPVGVVAPAGVPEDR